MMSMALEAENEPHSLGTISFGPFDQSSGFLVRLVQLRLFQAYYDGFADLDLRVGELSVLVMIGENPAIRQGTLAGALRIKRSHMAKIVHMLDTRGLLFRRIPPSDRRAVELSLTAAGRHLVADAVPRLLIHERQSFQHLSQAQYDTLVALLRMSAEPGTERNDD